MSKKKDTTEHKKKIDKEEMHREKHDNCTECHEENIDKEKENIETQADGSVQGEEIIKKMEEILSAQQQKYDAKLKMCESKMKEMYVEKLTALENQKKQYLMEIDNAKKYGMQKFISDLLIVADNLQLASNTNEGNYQDFISGLKMTINIFNETLKKYEVEQITVKIGDEFDESIHECLGVNGEGNKILQILKPGYKYNNRVIRAVQVIVG